MKRMIQIFYFILLVIAADFSTQTQLYAIVPPSAMQGKESHKETEQKLMNLLEKLERHEEDHIRFIQHTKDELRGLKR